MANGKQVACDTELLKDAIAGSGMSKQYLARILGRTDEYIDKVLRRGTIAQSVANQLSVLLGLNISDILKPYYNARQRAQEAPQGETARPNSNDAINYSEALSEIRKTLESNDKSNYIRGDEIKKYIGANIAATKEIGVKADALTAKLEKIEGTLEAMSNEIASRNKWLEKIADSLKQISRKGRGI